MMDIIVSSYNQADTTEYDQRQNHDIIQSGTSESNKPQAENNTELRIHTKQYGFKNLKKRSDEDEPPQSVIHAPAGFAQFKISNDDTYQGTTNISAEFLYFNSVKEAASGIQTDGIGKKLSTSSISPSPLTTAIEPAGDWSERATPRAQTRHDFEGIDIHAHSSIIEDEVKRSGHSLSEGLQYPEPIIGGNPSIYEPFHVETVSPEVNGTSHALNFAVQHLSDGEAEIKALKTALAECWKLCNTLAKLSYIHRGRLVDSRGSVCVQENAWTSCWRLCQGLYESQKDDHSSRVNPTLDLCREFCQTLFEVRIRDNELADSVLRVSFELNNHLYNTHDRTLPDAFRERTLDFYITLCHRLMKQRTRISGADPLLKACWSLAEMLFTIRQSKKEGRQMDEEILGSAVQACWELCDLFREGWTQRNLRCSDRGTPRPSQATFPHVIQQASQSEVGTTEEVPGEQGNPETPTTIFDEAAALSPGEAPIQNIFVLGQSVDRAVHTKWSSGSSSLSGRSQSSEQTSSTNTIITSSNDQTLKCVKALVTKAAMDSGFQPEGPQSLLAFVKMLSSDAFGSEPWQTSLLKSYKRFLALDPTFHGAEFEQYPNAEDIAKAVQLTVQGGRYLWLRDLYRLVFGFHVEEVSKEMTLN